jgi:hypothetical protein
VKVRMHQTYMEALHILQNPPEESFFFGVDRTADPRRLSGLSARLPHTPPGRVVAVLDLVNNGILTNAQASELLFRTKP